jgi:hypothetical protein
MARGASKSDVAFQPEPVWDGKLRDGQGLRYRLIPIGRATIDVANGQSIKPLEIGKTYDFQVKNGDAVGRAKVKFSSDGRIELDVLEAVSRGGGRVAIKAVIDLANRMRLPIYLWAQPINSAGGKMMKLSELTDWYKTFGFKPERMGGYDHASSMVYTPS